MTLKWQVNDNEPIIKELDVFDYNEIKFCIESSEVMDVMTSADMRGDKDE